MNKDYAHVQRCTKCILSENFPRIKFDDSGVCNFCNNQLLYTTEDDNIKIAQVEIDALFRNIDKQASDYDAIVCYSGGKDSTYTLKLAIEKYKLRVLSFTLDNGFISPTAFRNIEKVVSKLGVDHFTYRPSYNFMKGLYRVSSLETLYTKQSLTRISANCNSCISIVNMVALKTALEKNIPFILAGFTLGQIPANTIYYKNNYEFLLDSRKPVLDKLKNTIGENVRRYLELPESLQNNNYPYTINILSLEKITENEIVEQILPLGWQKPKDVDGCSTNCTLNAFNNYVHIKRHGYSPYELELSHLIRKELLSREEGLEKLFDQPKDQIEFAKQEFKIDDEMLK
ncbi:phosphoadenosine phosphosulfate reductase family protein [Saccharicrinis sp. FJH54]|uniref:phosphoadenosine phosphosulfate reductase domain-containing protein n=1 Tax=Saccharicrinis sp. FJH54 TaxID=3344665 RepID=UPI0035D45B84